MSSPARKKRADLGSSGSTSPRVDAESGLLPPEYWSQLPEEESAPGDEDSAVLDNASSTASLTSSILQYRTINGRAYQSERGNPEYWGPIDDTGQEAMDINHHVLTLLLGDKLYLAPVPEDIQTAVDIGTGTGIWAMEFADKFSNASVIGTDLAPIQPGWIPPNLEFQIEDCTQEWTFQPNTFDYIHMRWLVGSIADWKSLFKEAYKCLKPGGYIESYEPSSRVESDDGTVQPGRRPFTIFEENIQREAMREAGFMDIEERDFKNPVGGWPKDPKYRSVGQFMQTAFEQDAQGTVLHMATALGWAEEEITVFTSHFRREIRSPKIHSYFRQKVVWGRKPL
ncbi:related to methyltransferase [Fusarium fujikuroi]|nr:methyltransferase [Fusarium fujikuroi]SCN68538.1 related to methyltransferase [Fusarium fujikuroi]SCO17048.1 related to methyltransferase [Fusarium fujikuroi]SCO24147.1 related to methyltransferase [Fusarium fujikuroi]SCO34955.1 related to methyltransferase [Fusarium fujikuroi]